MHYQHAARTKSRAPKAQTCKHAKPQDLNKTRGRLFSVSTPFLVVVVVADGVGLRVGVVGEPTGKVRERRLHGGHAAPPGEDPVHLLLADRHAVVVEVVAPPRFGLGVQHALRETRLLDVLFGKVREGRGLFLEAGQGLVARRPALLLLPLPARRSFALGANVHQGLLRDSLRRDRLEQNLPVLRHFFAVAAPAQKVVPERFYLLRLVLVLVVRALLLLLLLLLLAMGLLALLAVRGRLLVGGRLLARVAVRIVRGLFVRVGRCGGESGFARAAAVEGQVRGEGSCPVGCKMRGGL
mmetsp:Transcript_21436/g.48385  ORF Transcript_21436/g.48385 Transcript_21436/m.48385 type:complete len:296 (-) Transcript_21436:115-1002(-)